MKSSYYPENKRQRKLRIPKCQEFKGGILKRKNAQLGKCQNSYTNPFLYCITHKLHICILRIQDTQNRKLLGDLIC